MAYVPLTRPRRTRLLTAITLALMAVFVMRLFYLQVIQHDYYAQAADNEQTRQWTLPASRGEIFVMDGEEPIKLVLNETVYTAWADPKEAEDPAAIEALLRRVAGDRVLPDIDEKLAKTDTRYQVLARNITSKEAKAMKEENLYGLGFTPSERRVYPEGKLASQVVGFVNAEGAGQYGVEGKLDNQLRGTDGLLKTVADVRDVPLTIGRENINIPAEDGQNVVLSIDRNIQQFAEKTLAENIKKVGAEYGSMMVMDPMTGQVMAMANLPTYDPTKINSIKNLEVLNNRIIARPYEPASVIKTLTMATGVDQGVMTPNSTFTNTDSVIIDGDKIENFTKGQTGEVTMQRALNWSLNTGTVEIAKWLGDGSINDKAQNTMYKYFHDYFHLGQDTGIELSGEAPGVVVNPDDVQGNAIRYANMTFGQGLTATPLQVASAFSTVINGGNYCQPTVIAGYMIDDTFTENDAKTCEQVIRSDTSSTLRKMITTARQEFYAGGDTKGFMVGGKTGTAEVANPTGGYDKNTSEGTYVGFGGEKGGLPAYVIIVTYAKPNTRIGGQDAIPTFTAMSNYMLDYLKLTPKG